MTRTLRIAFELRNAYRINALLYRLRQLPFLGRLLPPELYGSRGPRRLAAAITGLWELVTLFLWKGLYLWLMVFAAAELIAPGDWTAVLHVYTFLTVIGAAANTYLFDPKRNTYYAIFLLRMDARQYCLAEYGYKMARLVIGSIPLWLYLGLRSGVPWPLCLLAAVAPAGAKALVAASNLRDFARHGKNPDENKLVVPVLLGGAALLALAYVLPALGFVLPPAATGGFLAAALVLGLAAVRPIVTFRLYRPLCQQMLFDAIHVGQPATEAARQRARQRIDLNPAITSRRSGFAYLHELFIRRHRRILWRATLRQAAVLAILGAGFVAAALLSADAAEALGSIPRQALPYFVFLLYFLNRGTGFTQALFFHCDCSLLTYPFCKEPRALLRLFTLRLGSIVRVNLAPAAVLGVALAALLAAGGGTERPAEYAVLLVTPMAISVFFSIHYLALYYLLQPYNAATELRGGTYRLVTSATYFVCVLLMNLRMDTLVFGGLCLAFCALYCAAACVLVYRLAPRTFRIRN